MSHFAELGRCHTLIPTNTVSVTCVQHCTPIFCVDLSIFDVFVLFLLAISLDEDNDQVHEGTGDICWKSANYINLKQL